MTSHVRLYHASEHAFVEADAGATVALLDPGYLLGDGVFATLRGYAGRCFRARTHLAELARGAGALGITLPLPLDALEMEVHAAAELADPAYVRVTLTRGVDAPTLSIVARALEAPTARDYAEGVSAITASARRIPPACLDPTTKTTSYVAAVLARREAETRGAAEAIQLALDGSVACAAMANVFVVKDGGLSTPPTSTGCRAGVTRAAVLQLARAAGLDAREQRVEPAALLAAEEVFLANTRIECLPIATIDGRRIGRGAYPWTGRLRGMLRDLALREARR